MNKKILYISIIVIICFIAVILLYLFNDHLFVHKNSFVQVPGISNDQTPVNSDKVKMLKYQNDEYGISLYYPAKALVGPYQEDISATTTGYPMVSYSVIKQDDDFCLRPTGVLLSHDAKWYNDHNEEVPAWCVQVKEITSESQLLSFIKTKYGSACKYSLNEATSSPDNYNVNIIYDNGSQETSKCFPYQNYFIKYSPAKKILAYWNTGQECQISGGTCLDQAVADSFSFINSSAAK